MFKAYYRENIDQLWSLVTVYAVDFAHDAFLISWRDNFRWKPMSEFFPFNDGHNEFSSDWGKFE